MSQSAFPWLDTDHYEPRIGGKFIFILLIAILLFYSVSVFGQSNFGSARQKAGTARIFGAVTFDQSHLPARNALVIAIPSPNNKQPPTSAKASAKEAKGYSDLNGNYSLEVAGDIEYIVVAGLPGYLSWRDSSQDPTLVHTGTTVTVSVASSSRADLTLSKGAALEGTATYDDGSPASGLSVDVIPIHPDSVPFPRGVDPPQQTLTDDSGHYRIFGLLPGQYRAMAQLPDKSSAGTSQESIKVYADGVISEHAANVVQLQEGQQQSGVDILIPLSSLYTVSGVVSSPDGRNATSGFVALEAPSSPTDSRHAALSSSGSFSFSYVPAGSYCLRAAHVLYSGPAVSGASQGATSLKPSCLQVNGDSTMVSVIANPRE